MKRLIVIAVAVLVVIGASLGLRRADEMARVVAAYKAKDLCSEVFLAGRAPAAVEAVDFENIHPAFAYAHAHIDQAKQSVSASIFGLGAARAIYRPGYGCTLVAGGAPAPLPEAPAPTASAPLPEAPPVPGRSIARVDYAALEDVLNAAISDPAAHNRAFVVLVDGEIVGERYAPGFSETTPMLSWSMAKSVTASLVGAAVFKGYVDVNAPAPVPEWKDDPKRAAITWNDLLRMTSGLKFDETYDDPNSDVSKMLFRARDAGALAAKEPLLYQPGQHWSYSSGTANIVARALAATLKAHGTDIFAFAREALFSPIGATSFTLEPDSSGTPIGSSYVYATARDWARLGELYLQDGVWNGERLLPEGWPAYVSRATLPSDGQYGAMFWLNEDGASGRPRFVPGLPQDVYYMAGHDGQYVFIIPDKNAVVVRLGATRDREPIDVAGPVVAAIADAIGDKPAAPQSADAPQ
ncbi:MAG: serine hydrolase [Alphaproteobacteria bacterium]|nr:serine hydrolase [Alphaproteobacteria bacterium]